MADKHKIVIIAGPNGAGKTTFARQFLPNEADCPIFVNADLIAAALAPFSPETAAIRAGRLMLAEIDNHVRRGESFAFETNVERLNVCALDSEVATARVSGKANLPALAHRWQSRGSRTGLRKGATSFPRPLFDAALMPAGITSIQNISFSSTSGRCMIILNRKRFSSRRA